MRLRWLAGLALAALLALPPSAERFPFQAGDHAAHWCIHDLFRALGVLIDA